MTQAERKHSQQVKRYIMDTPRGVKNKPYKLLDRFTNQLPAGTRLRRRQVGTRIGQENNADTCRAAPSQHPSTEKGTTSASTTQTPKKNNNLRESRHGDEEEKKQSGNLLVPPTNDVH